MTKERSLMNRMMGRLAVVVLLMLLLSIPILYYVTTHYYAEDLRDIVVSYGIVNPDIDLERDTLVGIFIQFFSIILLLTLALYVVMQYVPQRLWRPFYQTLNILRGFNVEQGKVPELPRTNIKEFNQLNRSLTAIMSNSVRSYRVQKEFTENASHELQTPLAVAQSKLDNLLQDAELTERQAAEIQTIYEELNHMSRLSRNLLLLSRIDNGQYATSDHVDLAKKVRDLLPNVERLAPDLHVETDLPEKGCVVSCNEVLVESLLTNLIVNAVRHNLKEGRLFIKLTDHELTVANTSADPELDGEAIFQRFYRLKGDGRGYGLGLAIAKSICDYHKWDISYHYRDGMHYMVVQF